MSDSFTRFHASEFCMCADEPTYFIEKYVKVTHPAHDVVVPLLMSESQAKIVHSLHQNERSHIIIGGRQSGKSVVPMAYFFWYMLFGGNHTNIGIVVQPIAIKHVLRNIMWKMWINLPNWMQKHYEFYPDNSIIRINNNTLAICRTDEIYGYRSTSFKTIMIDEAAYVNSLTEILNSINAKNVILSSSLNTWEFQNSFTEILDTNMTYRTNNRYIPMMIESPNNILTSV